jgi:basic membrane protein A and related proteins
MTAPSCRTRRRLLAATGVAAALAVALAVGVHSSGAAGKPRVAALFTQSVSQGNWDPAGFAALSAMATKYGLQKSYVEQASYEKAPAILRDLASKGVQLIITHSSGYAAAMEQVAPKFPKTEFVLYSYAGTTKGLKNYSAWSMDWNQYGYVVGVMAASASKNHHIAIIAGQPIPSEKAAISYIQKGAKKADPTVKVDVAYVGSWTDVAKAKEIATQAIGRGADFLVPSADTADAGTQQAAEENGALTMGEYIDQSSSYPKSIVTSSLVNFKHAYLQIGQAFTQHKLHGQIVQMGIKTHDLTFKVPFKHVPASVQKKVFTLMNQIATGQITP